MTDCPLDRDVLGAVMSGHWLDESSSELRAHAEDCPVCRETAAMSSLLGIERDAAMLEADPPSAGQVWWRAQMRARAEAAHTAERPLLIAQGLGAACILGIVAAVISWFWPRLESAGSWLYASTPTGVGLSMWLAIGAWLILLPVALYLVFARE
jgi:predicted anti-sigma-YlaC factor YlaD